MGKGFLDYDAVTTNDLLRTVKENKDRFPLDSDLNEFSEKLLPNSVISREINKIKDATSNNKGYFLDVESLKDAYPTANEGSKAYVGNSYPYMIYLFQGGEWINSGQAGGDDTFNAGDFYTKLQIDQQREVINGEISRVENGANYEVLEYEINIATTRLKVDEKNRKGGYMITYNPGTGWIKEQYIGELTDNEEWIKDENWKPEILNDSIQAIAENAQKQADLASKNANMAMTQANYANEQANNAKNAALGVTSEVLKTMPVGTMLMSAKGNIFGEEWIESGSFIINEFEEIAIKEAQIYASYRVFSDDNVTFVVLDTKMFYSKDGYLWNECNIKFNNEDSLSVVSVCQFSNNIYYAIGFSFLRFALIKSEDGGVNWSELEYPFDEAPIMYLVRSGVYLYAIGNNVCYYISGYEDVWTKEETGATLDFSLTSSSVIPYKKSSDIGIILITGNNVYSRKSFRDNSWEQKANFTSTNSDNINCLYCSYSEKLGCFLIATIERNSVGGGSIAKLYKSEDLESWDDITHTLPNGEINYIGGNINADGFFVLYTANEYLYSNDLVNWISGENPSINDSRLCSNNKNIFVISIKGILYKSDNPIFSPEIPYGYVKIK